MDTTKLLLRIFAPLILTLPVEAQCFTMAGTNGLGYSTPRAIDRDGDGYGVGPTALVNTTVAASIASGSQTVTPASMTNIATGTALRIEPGANQECLVVASTTGTTFTATFAHAHGAGVTVLDLGVIGTDSDDLDSTIHTADQGCSRYGGTNCTTQGSLVKFLQHLGYAASSHIYYLATGGSDMGSPPNCRDNIAAPCATHSYIATSLVADDIVIFRNAWDGRVNYGGGTTGHPLVYMGYPGELPVIDNTGNPGNQFNGVNVGNVTFDNFRFKGGAGIGGGTFVTNGVIGSDLAPNITVRHVETIDGGASSPPDSAIGLRNGISGFLIEDVVTHDNTTGHGLYTGNKEVHASSGTFRRILTYHNSFTGFQWTGTTSGTVTFQQIVSHDNDGACFSFEEGPSNAIISSNLGYNCGDKTFIFFVYDGSDGGNNCGVGPSQTCTCNPQNVNAICAFSFNNNVVENNTFYSSGYSGYSGGFVPTNPTAAIEVARSGACTLTNCTTRNFDSNIFRNNILVSYGNAGSSPAQLPIYYTDQNGNCVTGGGECLEWLSTSTFTDNTGFWSDGTNGTGFLGIGTVGNKTCAQAATYTTISGCTMGDPKFISAASSFHTNSAQYDFRILITSPAYQTGTTTGIPNYDLAGRVYTDGSPSRGALERNLYQQGWNLLTGAKLANTADGGGTLCPADGANGSTGWNNVGAQAVPYNTNCHNVIDAYSGGFLREAPGVAPKLCIDGSGHSDGGDNDIYCVNVAAASPAMTRVTTGGNFPTQYTLSDWGNCPTGLPDASPTTAPNARHTTGGISYIPTLDRMWLTAGGLACGNGTHSWDSWLYNFSNNTFAVKNPMDCTDHGFGAGSGSPTCSTFTLNKPYDAVAGVVPPGNCPGENAAAWDPVTQTELYFFCDGQDDLLQYFPQVNQIIARGNGFSGAPNFSDFSMAVMNYDDRIFWVFGGNYPTHPGQVIQYNIAAMNTTTAATGSVYTSTCTGDTVCNTVINTLSSGAPGLAYRSINRTIYAWLNAGSAYYTMPAGTLLGGTTVSASGGPSCSFPCATNGVYGKFQYSAGLDAMVLIPAYNASTAVLSPNAADPAAGCTITPSVLGQWTNTQVINQTLTESGCNASTFALAGSWPTGLSGCSSGAGPTCTISGTISAAGTFTPTVTYDTASNAYSIVVNAVPVVTTSCPLPAGIQNQTYGGGAGILTASPAGTTPDTWSLSAGSLPTGLSISGNSVTGVPLSGGTSSFTLEVTDTNGITATKACSITIAIAKFGPEFGAITVSGFTR